MTTPSNSKPVLLDLCCGAGGCTKGYQRAGFYVIGVDIDPQKNYCGDEFWQADAIDTLLELIEYPQHFGGRLAAIHASPPCQRFSAMSTCRPGLASDYADLVAPIRDLCRQSGLPYVIENVPNSPLINPVTLCGQMFGLDLYRHRLFEANFSLVVPPHPEHVLPASRAGHWTPGTVMSVAGHISPMWKAREVMGIDWCNREELSEAIPPAYTEWIGWQLRFELARRASGPRQEVLDVAA